MTVNAVSPSSPPSSGFARDASLFMRVMMPVLKLVRPLMGMTGTLEAAAGRYVEAVDLGDGDTGHFYATTHPRKAVGPVAIQTNPDYFTDRESQEAGFEAVVKMTGVPFPEINEPSEAR